MFSKGKQNALKKEKLQNYLKYAIGEIILIVIGILVAFSLQNWNDNIQQHEELKDIYASIHNDLKRDTVKLNDAIHYYQTVDPVFWKMAECQLSAAELKQCQYCTYITSGLVITRLDRNGFEKLKTYEDWANNSKSDLDFEVVNFYSSPIAQINGKYSDLIYTTIKNNLRDWRDHYSWFNEMIFQDYDNAEAAEYFGKSQDYKNRVAYVYLLIYGEENYLDQLKYLKAEAKKLLRKIDAQYHLPN